MHILLAKPPFARLLGSDAYLTYPLGLMGVASMLKAAGHDVTIYHDDVSNPAPIPPGSTQFRDVLYSGMDSAVSVFCETVDDIQPDVVGISYTTSDVDAARRMSAECRSRGIRTVAGGIHPSLRPQEEMGFFDAVVAGEGDTVQAALAFKSSECEVHQIVPIGGTAIPCADRDCVIGGERYSPYLRGMVQTQRGCPYHCAFCATPEVFGTKVRTRDPGVVREEVESLGVSSGRIIDDSFGVVKSHGLAICRELAKVNYNWVCDMAVRDVDDEIIDAMVGAGCTQINVGVESAVDTWRELSGKGATPYGVEHVMGKTAARGVTLVIYFMIGWPGETQVELEYTLQIAKSLKDRGAKPCISIVTPYPGTALWEMCGVEGQMPWGEFMHQSRNMGFADVSPEVWERALDTANELNR